MTTLARAQEALVDALFAWPAQEAVQRLESFARGVGASPQRGLLAYQANGHMLAARALQAAYPVVAQLLGDESFAHLARAHWHAHPPTRGDIAQWGAELPLFIQSDPQLSVEPYLPDVARVEWRLHCASTAMDQEAHWTSLALLTEEDPQTLGLTLAPGTSWVCSAWPVASIWLAHSQEAPSLAEAGALIRQRVPQDCVVWRQGLSPQLRQALPGEFTLLDALGSGAALEPALSVANTLDFTQWLPLAIQTGLVLGAYRLSTKESP